jgi:mono/diheme cytochrome c family protein
MRKLFVLLTAVALIVVLAACGGNGGTNDTGSTGGDAARGEQLFKQTIIGSASAPGCITCHSLEAGVVLVGPAQNNVGAEAGMRVPGQSAEDYLRESIVDPDAYVVDGFAPGLMYQFYGRDLTEQQIDDLVAYMLTLRN